MNRPKIYLLCPADTATGGPEAIHQLGVELVARHHDVRIVYLGLPTPKVARGGGWVRVEDLERKKPDAFAAYDVPHAVAIEDAPENLVVIPEGALVLVPAFQRIAKAVWWLSVDNGLPGLGALGGPEALRRPDLVHFSQSAYAEHFLAGHGVREIHRLHDYLNPVFLAADRLRPRRDRVLYNPRKGREVIDVLRGLAPELEWTAIDGMAPAEVRDLLATSKVYVDFGPHPGKDRIPREAAIAGCCVLVGRRGSARFFQDVPVDARYAFDMEPLDARAVLATIADCLENHPARADDFAYYRRAILEERGEFQAQVRRIFG